jgi:hypothetical protein
MQISISIPDYYNTIIEAIAQETGQSKSSIVADCVKNGLSGLLETLNKAHVYQKTLPEISLPERLEQIKIRKQQGSQE